MDETEDNRRTIAACKECGALYAALELGAGKLHPIGRQDGCQCGCTEFTSVDGSLAGLSRGEGDD
ncbi:hypothetical protein A6E15_04320 [Natrinema saccharevitans]|uniref:Uncharacterized protein n=1 Tax=Natrinema saccharevitans TaxID=301967 RepID=A0A1S8AV31_9EURY|nr:hypothetical protein [Natrinema saccharevitans]OLZ40254.1 hypothetical protein A6E15_04320 [Natrinema saccharevitans]